MSNRRKRRRVLDEKGPPCPRCTRLMQVREHKEVSERELRRPFYYSRWYRCMNGNCKTTLVMPPEFRIFPPRDPEIWS